VGGAGPPFLISRGGGAGGGLIRAEIAASLSLLAMTDETGFPLVSLGIYQ